MTHCCYYHTLVFSLKKYQTYLVFELKMFFSSFWIRNTFIPPYKHLMRILHFCFSFLFFPSSKIMFIFFHFYLLCSRVHELFLSFLVSRYVSWCLSSLFIYVFDFYCRYWNLFFLKRNVLFKNISAFNHTQNFTKKKYFG